MQEIREEFDKHGFIISFAVSSFPYRISLGIDPENLSKHAHFLNVLSYEYHGFWESKVGVGAPLRAVKDNMNIVSDFMFLIPNLNYKFNDFFKFSGLPKR